MRTARLFVAAVVLVAFASHAHAQRDSTRRALNGEWMGTLALDNSSPTISLVFQLTDSTFAGKVFTDGGLMGAMEDGSLTGNRVHFKVDRFDFTGTVTKGRMKVDLIVWNGTVRSFTLTKTAEAPRDTSSGPERGRYPRW